MSLQGVLSDFGVADIFQLIAQQRKTGILSVEARSRPLEIHFLDGGVLRARPSESRPDAALAALMIRTGMLSEAALGDAWEKQAKSRKPLPAVLTSLNLIDAKAMAAARRLLTDESIFELFLWNEGRFSFRPCRVDQGEDEAVGAEMVLLDALRMRDEWGQIKTELHDLNLVIGPTVDIETFHSHRDMVEAATGLPPQEIERVFALVDGRLSARRVIDLSRLGTFQGGRAVVALLREGVVALSNRVAAANTASVRAPKQRPLLGFAVLVSCALWALLLLRLPVPASGSDYPIPEDAVREARTAAATERLRSALEAHRWAHGGYPESLEGLRELHGGLLAPLAVDRYSYSRSAEGYVLQLKLSFSEKEAPGGSSTGAASPRAGHAGR